MTDTKHAKLVTAEEARAVSHSNASTHIDKQLQEIADKIDEAAKKSEFMVYVCGRWIAPGAIAKLKYMGYKVELSDNDNRFTGGSSCCIKW